MSYYPKEGLITLHQAQNPPISQAITEELNKVGYGEFITETELSNELMNELNPINLKINSLSNSIGFNGIVQLPTINVINQSINFSGPCKFIAPDTGDLITIDYTVGITQQNHQPLYYFYILYRPEAPASSYYAATTTFDPTKLNMFVSELVAPNQIVLTYYSNQLNDRLTTVEGNIFTLQNDFENLETGTVLTIEQVNKINELLPYSIGANGNYANTWPNILTIKSDGVTEIGSHLDFHLHQWEQYQTNEDFQARISVLSGLGNEPAGTKHLMFSGQFVIDSIRTYKLKITDLNGTLSIFNNTDYVAGGIGSAIVTFKNDKSTEFFGEISTPSFNSAGVNNTLTNLQDDLTNHNHNHNDLIILTVEHTI